MIVDPEDEAFNDIERQAKQRRESVIATIERAEQRVAELKERVDSLNPYREQVIEEVAQSIEKMTGFGKDTISSFATHIRGLK